MDAYEHLTDTDWRLAIGDWRLAIGDWRLFDHMDQISEDCFCGGWIGGNAFDV